MFPYRSSPAQDALNAASESPRPDGVLPRDRDGEHESSHDFVICGSAEPQIRADVRGPNDMSNDFVIAVPRNREAEMMLERIEDRIEVLEERLAPLMIERQRLLPMRAALLGEAERKPERARPVRVTREDVAAAVEAAPGSRAGAIARALGTTQQIVSAHLYRGKTALFQNRGGRWYPRREPIAA